MALGLQSYELNLVDWALDLCKMSTIDLQDEGEILVARLMVVIYFVKSRRICGNQLWHPPLKQG